jgi:hypothetical protein
MLGGAAKRSGFRWEIWSRSCPSRTTPCTPLVTTSSSIRGASARPRSSFPYGNARFASTAGDLAGNHFLTVAEGRDQFAEFGTHVLWNGALDIVFEAVP